MKTKTAVVGLLFALTIALSGCPSPMKPKPLPAHLVVDQCVKERVLQMCLKETLASEQARFSSPEEIVDACLITATDVAVRPIGVVSNECRSR